ASDVYKGQIQYIDHLVEEFPDYEQASIARLIQEGLVYMGKHGGTHDSAVEPSTYNEAINSAEKEQWIKAMQDEVDTLVKRGTWE
ncbi:hypothetical protein, partial [Escherichia coli]|uniref:hypothetical protein n=1 Tax=Escherichia coli TaxID=562 RepID=UPI001590222B